VGALDLGFYNNNFDNDWSNSVQKHINQTKPVVFLLNLDDFDLSILDGAYVVYIGHHGEKGAHIADLILPSPAFPERTSTFVNTEGRVMQTTKCFQPLGESKEEWKIFRAISDEFNSELIFNNIGELRKEIIKNFPYLKEINVLPDKKNIDFESFVKIADQQIDYNISNFYMTDSISRSSETMAKCTKEILNKVA